MTVLWELAAIAPVNGACAHWGAPARWSQDRTIGDFQNQYTRIHFILKFT